MYSLKEWLEIQRLLKKNQLKIDELSSDDWAYLSSIITGSFSVSIDGRILLSWLTGWDAAKEQERRAVEAITGS